MMKNTNPYYHKFSWLKGPVDVRKDCKLCLLYRNSPCEPIFNKWGTANTEAQKEPKNDPKTEEAEKLLDKVMECVNNHKDLFLKRESEMNEFVKKIRNFEK
jgi:hypothetical protein